MILRTAEEAADCQHIQSSILTGKPFPQCTLTCCNPSVLYDAAQLQPIKQGLGIPTTLDFCRCCIRYQGI